MNVANPYTEKSLIMNLIKRNKFQSAALMAGLSIALLAGCDQSEPTVDATESQAGMDQPQAQVDQPQASMDQSQAADRPLEHVAEFDAYTLRANITPTERLPEAMAQEYGIDADPSLLLLNVVIMEKRSDGLADPVSGEVSVSYENLVGDESTVDMRAAEADGLVSYIGTLDASGQLVFRFVIEAQPEGADEPLETDFEVQLPPRDTN